jgi:VanZ family protein
MLRKKYPRTFLSGVAAAALDEVIQIFVPDRFSSVKDVLLDSCGVLTGMLLIVLGHTLLKKRTF